MRLLNITTFKLEEFWENNDTPDYAILSHTWEEEEVSFQVIADLNSASQLLGFKKIQASCRQASEDGLDWIWIDTCCIDKSSSAELSEAINSMFRWYKNSTTCYAYLSDVPSNEDPEARGSSFSKSRWFTRGWTLQELVAPREVEFFSKDWVRIGCQRSLCLQISNITGINVGILTGKEQFDGKSIAQRMSWASRRFTTRPEDMAYCLMGLFDVNMPLLYGEGQKAFQRLQEEILKRSNDQSLFAWTAASSQSSDSSLMGGFLSHSPRDFEFSNKYISYKYFSRGLEQPHSMTNMGLCIKFPVIKVPGVHDERIVILACTSTDFKPGSTLLGLFVRMDCPPSKYKDERLPRVWDTHSYGSGSRFIDRAPVSLKLDNSGMSGSQPWVSVHWHQPECRLDGVAETLYIPQQTFVDIS